jgi:hypothetical protein
MTKKKEKNVNVNIKWTKVETEPFAAEQRVAKELLGALDRFRSVYDLTKADGEIAIAVQRLGGFVLDRTPKAVEDQIAATKRGTLNALFSRTKRGAEG